FKPRSGRRPQPLRHQPSAYPFLSHSPVGRPSNVRYAYAITAALLAGGAPASFAYLTARLSPAVVNISTTQRIKVPQQQNPFAGTPFDDLFRQFNGGGGGDDVGDDNSGGVGCPNGGKPQPREAMSLGSGFIISAD